MDKKKPGILSRYQALIDRKLHPELKKPNKKSKEKKGPKSSTLTIQDVAKEQNVKFPEQKKKKPIPIK